MHELKQKIGELYIEAKQVLGFTTPCSCILKNDPANAENIFGKTAYYDPQNKVICLYVTNRHPKDILRSFAHELVHHLQNERGDLMLNNLSPGYAQEDEHLREMEIEAYLKGNLLLRDWEDRIKYNSNC